MSLAPDNNSVDGKDLCYPGKTLAMKEHLRLNPVVKKRISLWLMLLVILLTVGGLSWRERALRERIQVLMDQPEPLPGYILGLVPYPGTTYPVDERSKIYWIDWDATEEFSRGSVVCAAINAQIINPLVSPSNESDELLTLIPESSVDLYLNGLTLKMFDLQAERKRFVSFPMIFPPYVDILYCWKMSLAPGDYLATLVVHPVDGEDLRYQWAFAVENH